LWQRNSGLYCKHLIAYYLFIYLQLKDSKLDIVKYVSNNAAVLNTVREKYYMHEI